MTFVNPSIPALKYRRDMEIEAVSAFAEYFRNYHQDCIISECRLILDKTISYIGTSSDRLMSYSCYCRACTEIKWPYSINYTGPNEQNLDYLYSDGDAVNLKQSQVFHTMPYANGGYKKQNCFFCGLEYAWNGDRQYYF